MEVQKDQSAEVERNKKMVNFTIIIPLYNKEAAIRQTLNSVLRQSYTNYEIVIVDDGSTDNSRNIVESIRDERILYYYKENGGVSSARNYGIERSRNNWIVFLDADDELCEESLMTFKSCIEKFPQEKVVVGNVINDSGEKQSLRCHCGSGIRVSLNPYKEMYLNKIAPRTGAYAVHRDAVSKSVYFDERLSFFEDFDFMSRLMDHYSFIYTMTPVIIYHQKYASLSLPNHPIEKELAYYVKKDRVTGNFWREMEFSSNMRYSEYVRLLAGDKTGAEFYRKKYLETFSPLCRFTNILLDQKKRVINRINNIFGNDR